MINMSQMVTKTKFQSSSNDQHVLDGDQNQFSIIIQWSTMPYVKQPKPFFGCPWIHCLFTSDQIFDHLWSPNVAFNESFPKTCYMHPFPNLVIGDRKFSIAIQQLRFFGLWPKPIFGHRPTINMFQMAIETNFQSPYTRQSKFFFNRPWVHCFITCNQIFDCIQSPFIELDESFPETYYMHPFFQI
jgi:hypothetical protein